jgi:hypothetical protein
MVIRLKRDAICGDCGHRILKGTLAKWYRSGAVFGLFCHGEVVIPTDSRTRATGEREETRDAA